MTECPHEQDVLEAVVSTRWPHDLRTHVDLCPVCRDLATVAAALHDEGQAARSETQPPTSGQVWWRATMRTRAEAARTAARPIAVLQALSAACVVGVLAAVLTRSWTSIGQSLTSIADALSVVAMQQTLVVGLVLGAGLVLAPLILYLVLSDD
jgi:hypothetical protein